MSEHAHPHRAGNDPDPWAKQHAEKGEALERALAPATEALLEGVAITKGSRVLDVACGAGQTTAAAADAGAEATGIDTSEAMVRIARERFPTCRFEVGDMRAPPSGPWDAIVCRLGAHHADPAWLAEAWRVLVPGGRLAIAERDAVDETSRGRGMRTLGEWMASFRDAGFDEVEARATGAELGGRVYVITGRRPIAHER